jgi:DNA-binding IclR family transcriptional regulator
MPEQEARDLLAKSKLERRTSTTRTDPEEIMASLSEIREKGYCLSDQDAFLGDISVAAAVFDDTNLATAAVNIAVPWPQWSVDRVEKELAPIVTDAARSISLALNR